ncbi:MAG: Hsp70 family protein [Inquilinus limosus]|uniref:Hsp70 family protein n=1 Tax=Inquilinus limosus TaxID=171674 RepID=A0A952FHZ4_9PROT|nr:Hsp70 family protein [Inquilinus limosus]
MAVCGLDFGTSNSTLGIVDAAGARLLPLEGAATTLPSAIWFDLVGGAPRFGRSAIDSYVDSLDGRLMRSIKSVLGTPLIEEDTWIGRERIGFKQVIGIFLAEMKARAEAACGHALERVVHGRPVHFVDDDPAGDRAAQDALQAIAREAGFAEVSFEYEPIAAARTYEAGLDREEVALIVDIGGGTSDISIVRLGPQRKALPDRAGDILANDGIRLGGTDVDRLFSLATVMPALGMGTKMKRQGAVAPSRYFHMLATWSRINALYAPKVVAEVRDVRRESRAPEKFDRLLRVLEGNLGHSLALRVEAAKIALGDKDPTVIDLRLVEPKLGLRAGRAVMDAAIRDAVGRLSALIRRCIQAAGLTPDGLDAVFLTGGSALLPAFRAAALAEAPAARVVEGDSFGAVGVGLAIEARRRYGS